MKKRVLLTVGLVLAAGALALAAPGQSFAQCAQYYAGYPAGGIYTMAPPVVVYPAEPHYVVPVTPVVPAPVPCPTPALVPAPVYPVAPNSGISGQIAAPDGSWSLQYNLNRPFQY